jgi:hypothetical protein
MKATLTILLLLTTTPALAQPRAIQGCTILPCPIGPDNSVPTQQGAVTPYERLQAWKKEERERERVREESERARELCGNRPCFVVPEQ